MEDQEFKELQAKFNKKITAEARNLFKKGFNKGLIYGAISMSIVWVIMDLIFGVFQ